jgi:hypothetical protein
VTRDLLAKAKTDKEKAPKTDKDKPKVGSRGQNESAPSLGTMKGSGYIMLALDVQEEVPCHSCGYPTMTALAPESLTKFDRKYTCSTSCFRSLQHYKSADTKILQTKTVKRVADALHAATAYAVKALWLANAEEVQGGGDSASNSMTAATTNQAQIIKMLQLSLSYIWNASHGVTDGCNRRLYAAKTYSGLANGIPAMGQLQPTLIGKKGKEWCTTLMTQKKNSKRNIDLDVTKHVEWETIAAQMKMPLGLPMVAQPSTQKKGQTNADQLRAEVESVKTALATALAEKEELEEQLAEKNELEALVKTLQEKLAVFQSDTDSSKRCTASEILAAKNEAADAKAQAETLTNKLEELEVELREARDALKKQEAEFAAKMADEIAKVHMEHEQLSSGTMHSESMGVKVAVPHAAPPTVTSIPDTAGKHDEEDDKTDSINNNHLLDTPEPVRGPSVPKKLRQGRGKPKTEPKDDKLITHQKEDIFSDWTTEELKEKEYGIERKKLRQYGVRKKHLDNLKLVMSDEYYPALQSVIEWVTKGDRLLIAKEVADAIRGVPMMKEEELLGTMEDVLKNFLVPQKKYPEECRYIELGMQRNLQSKEVRERSKKLYQKKNERIWTSEGYDDCGVWRSPKYRSADGYGNE